MKETFVNKWRNFFYLRKNKKKSDDSTQVKGY